MIELTPDQRHELSEATPTVVDPETREHYILVRKDVFERVRHLLYDDSDWTPDEMRAMLANNSKGNGWDEPGMEEYDNYPAKK